MNGVSRQKQKLLIMERLFRERTDETHVITGNELISILVDMGLKAERKTIYDDIATLQDAGLDIRTTKKGHSNAYYLASRTFADEELRIIADAVSTSRLLTIKKSNEINRKIRTLTSEHKASALKRSVSVENRTKSSESDIYDIVDFLHERIAADEKALITYTGFGPDGGRRPHMRGSAHTRRSLVSPYMISWENEKYYCICFCEDKNGGGKGEICRMSLERMSDPASVGEKRHVLSSDDEAQIRRLRFPQDSSESKDIRILFDESLYETAFDRFGGKIVPHTDGDGTFYIDVSAKLTPQFWGWLFSLGGMARIISPESAAKRAQELAEEISEVYSTKVVSKRKS